MGGDLSRFPSTSLSMILQAADPSQTKYREHVERLASKYWKPIYYYVRRAWSKSDADAKDLTQSFLVHVLERDLLRRFDVHRGNFRAYLKQCLKNFLSTDARDADRLKRGGGAKRLSLDGSEAPPAVPASQAPPDEEFERDWAREVLDRCLREVEAHFKRQKKDAYWEAFRRYALLPGGEASPTYREVADPLGLTESDVRNYLRFVRRELRLRVIKAIGEYVVAEDDILAEVAAILGEE